MTLQIPSDWTGYLDKAGIIDLAMETVYLTRFNPAECRLPIRDEVTERQEMMLIFTCTVLLVKEFVEMDSTAVVVKVAAYMCVVVDEA